MGDIRLPFEERDLRPLRVMFLDLNSYFASVQQAENPELRGKPVGVCAVPGDSSFLIAASTEAKALGVKTLMRIGDAKQLCPELILVNGGHGIYSDYHDRILEAVESVLPVDQVKSIDEMQFRLIGVEREPKEAERLAMRMKQAIWDQVSPALSCSIGVAPNSFLAKLATDLQKPNGLVIIHGHELPERLAGLQLMEFCGINRRMLARMQAHGIFDAADLIARSKQELVQAFGSVYGERWYYMLRGHEVEGTMRQRQSLGHSHVLPPDLRHEEGVREVLLRLLQKASARLRASQLWATTMNISVSGKKGWDAHIRFPATQDSVRLTREALALFEHHTFVAPMKVSIGFNDLLEAEGVTLSLFEQEEMPRIQLNHAVDKVNQQFGKNSIYLAAMHRAKDTAEERIAFQKTSLFDEGARKKRVRRSPEG